MTQNNNFSVLPWYDSIELQNHRRSYAFGNIYPLFAQTDVLLPFQIIRRHRNTSAFTFNLYDKKGNFIKDISDEVKKAGLAVRTVDGRQWNARRDDPNIEPGVSDFNEDYNDDFGDGEYDYDVIIFPALTRMNTSMNEGMYYMTLSDGFQTWYSEIFTLVNDVTDYLKIEWYDTTNLFFDSGVIIYEDPVYSNFLYLCTELGKPDYQFEEEGEDRDGYFFPEKRISEKTYKCTILASEYLCDLMRFIGLSDYVKVTDKYGRKYDCDTFLITPKWQTQGDLASVEIEFETDTVVKKIGKALTGTDDRIQLSVNPAEIETVGGFNLFNVISNYAWKIINLLDWVVVDVTNGVGNKEIHIAIGDTEESRTGNIIVQTIDGSKSATLTIKQPGKLITVSQKILTIEATDTSTKTVKINSTDSWTSETI